MIEIYTDGSSTGRANREWGWGFIAIKDNKVLFANYGGGPSGTNNIAEIRAAIEGLGWVVENDIKGPITVVSDSQYVIGIGSGTYIPQKNLDSCYLLKDLVKYTNAEFKWVRGHGNNEFNNIVDQLAKLGKMKYAKLRR